MGDKRSLCFRPEWRETLRPSLSQHGPIVQQATALDKLGTEDMGGDKRYDPQAD